MATDKIEVVITSLIEMLELPHLVTWTNLQYNLNHVMKFCWWCHQQELWCQPLFQNTIILRKPGVAIFADIIKILTRFIKKIFRLKKSYKKEKLCIKMESISVFLDITKLADFWWKNADVSRTQGLPHVIDSFFWSSLGKV